MQHCLGSAGTQAAGLWQFLRDAADSKQLHTAKAAANGLLSAYLARGGFTGASEILTGAQGMSAGMSSDADPGRLTEALGSRWAIAETSFKVHASCRHTHPAADALLQLMRERGLDADDVASVTAHVHQGALDVLGPVTDPQTIHQAKFSMGFVLALVALYGRAGLSDFSDATLADPHVRAFHDRVRMVLDPDVDAAYPGRWMGRVTVALRGGGTVERTIAGPAGDPEEPLSRVDLERKARRLAAYANGATDEEVSALAARVWRLPDEADVRNFLKPA
jgi:2-methylcitrate dehydratase PrpD